MINERRLDDIRREAERSGRVDAKGVRAQGAPLPQANAENGYYGLPLLKEPVWTWEVPMYFFVGGTAGAAAAVGAAAQLTGADRDLVRDARWIAAAGAALSAPLLMADLGRPERFLNMLRVFKVQSPMSVGAWTLTAFGAFASAAAFAEEMRRKTDLPVRLVGDAAGMLSAATGVVMATYTGVLVGATAIPLWSKHVSLLPLHFGASALSSAVSMLELLGHKEEALNVLGFAAAAFETYVGYRIERDPDTASDPMRRGPSGITARIAGTFSGPVPLILRVIGFGSKRFRTVAAVSTIFGSLITRFAWVEAGRASVRGNAAGVRQAIGERSP